MPLIQVIYISGSFSSSSGMTSSLSPPLVPQSNTLQVSPITQYDEGYGLNLSSSCFLTQSML